MLKRKIYDDLLRWKKDGTKPLLIYGQRQVGKTYIIDAFAKENYDTYIYANLDEEGDFSAIFEQSNRTVDDIMLSIRTLRQIKELDPNTTLIFLDEIQACPEALSSLKSFRKDGRFNIVASGSMLGVTTDLSGDDGPVSPMGDVRQLRMSSMDFEEFLWANDIPQDAIDLVRRHIRECSEIESPILEQFSRLFRIYQITGGMPASVQAYVDDRGSFTRSSEELEDIVLQIRRDITKYNNRTDAVRTAECFESIPYQLSQTNKKFQYSRVDADGKATRKAADKYLGNLLWIGNAGYCNFCYALNDIGRPLRTRIKRDVFRTYMSDTGVLTHMMGDTAVKAVYTNDVGFNKGALTENAVAEALTKCGYVPAYYVKNGGDCRMEIDFVVEMFDGIAAIEVKSGKTRDAPSIWKVSQHFSLQRRMIFENGNIRRTDDGIEHYPLFVSAFFDELDNRPDYI